MTRGDSPSPGRRYRPAIDPPRSSGEQLESARQRAIENFRKERLEEPLEAYLDFFETYQGTMENLLEKTVDLTQIEEHALDILTEPESLLAFRYLAGPPISYDDLKVLSEADSLSTARLRRDHDLVKRVIGTVLAGLDRRRFPWIAPEGRREPTEAERQAAILASAALIATQRVATQRRNTAKEQQEERVKAALRKSGFKEVAARAIMTLADGPAAGTFCGESNFGGRKADIVVGLWDRRAMPIECKVSNSALNSIKRVENDAAVKAKTWRTKFGENQVVPTAVLSGVYDRPMLERVQRDGLTLFWAHRLKSLAEWIERTKA